jgi:hypothetical protein
MEQEGQGADRRRRYGRLERPFQGLRSCRRFINTVRNQVTKGTSALFLLTGQVTVDMVQQELKLPAPRFRESSRQGKGLFL